jgi:hypothetical protein
MLMFVRHASLIVTIAGTKPKIFFCCFTEFSKIIYVGPYIELAIFSVVANLKKWMLWEGLPKGCQIFLGMVNQDGENCTKTKTKYTEWPFHIPSN